jgi:hypothetical protein
MRCPYLADNPLYRCEAADKLYVPSDFQLREYCKAKRYKRCPFYLFLSQINALDSKDFVTYS